MIKQATFYRIAGEPIGLHDLDEALRSHRFMPCAPTQAVSAGWVPPRGSEHDAAVEATAGVWVMRLATERRTVPGATLKNRVEELAQRVEEETGRKPGKKMRRELKEQALLELLPQAFTKRADVTVGIIGGYLIVGTATAARADDVVTALVRAWPGLQVLPVHTAESARSAMCRWLVAADSISTDFSIGRDCVLQAADETKASVKFSRHPLDTEEIERHVREGKLPTSLQLTHGGRMTFLLSETMAMRGIELLDVDGGEKGADAFDANVAITFGALGCALRDLVVELGGELRHDEATGKVAA